MSFNVEESFRRGGKPLLDYLTFCVFSLHLETVFAYLVREYRTHPTVPLALSLYDSFCAPGGPAHLAGYESLLPPRYVMLQREVEWLRESRATLEEWTAAAQEDDPSRHPPIQPVRKYLFDYLIDHMRGLASDPISAPAASYDPSLDPVENLPGGRLTPRQKRFVEGIWRPRVRPALVRAGFWRIVTVGG